MEVLRNNQADIMMILSGICGSIALFVIFTDSASKRRKRDLMIMELSAMLIMIADRQAYLSRGSASKYAWWAVRISNFLVFFLTLVVLFSYNLYLIDLLTHEGKLEKPPRRLKIAGAVALLGIASRLPVYRLLLYL